MRRIVNIWFFLWVILGAYSLAWGGLGSSKHNLSTSGPGPVKAVAGGTSQICVFCHTPHNADPAGPIWNRANPGTTYNVYESKTMEATTARPPDGSSKFCLTCHDGTIAIGNVLNLPGAGSGTLDMTDGGTGKLTTGDKLTPSSTGFTSYLGTNLMNDHPVSFVYDSTLASQDGELVNPSVSSYVGEGSSYPLTLDWRLKLQCTTCHDPHSDKYPKFLRDLKKQTVDWNPLKQVVATADWNNDGAIICLYCHNKEDVVNGGWIGSSHYDVSVADEIYKTGNYLGKTGAVWQDSCLACHDTHSVEGARRLLREGSDDTNQPKQGGNPASEETCYLCHTNTTDTVLDTTQLGYSVPDIETEFLKTYHMPIVTSEQVDTGAEVHDIKNADMEEITTEDYPLIGKVSNLDAAKRHVECTDCHNTHRVIKNSLYDGTGVGTQATHDHSEPHSNNASGVLRGMWGVEPDYTGCAGNWWDVWPTCINYGKRGTPDLPAVPSLDKEYQVCLKCHSSYAYGNTPPDLGSTGGSTGEYYLGSPFLQYTDQAKEFNPDPVSGNASFHPVIGATTRTLSNRAIDTIDPNNNPFLSPFKSYVGSQTMYCSDCHGKNTSGQGQNGPVPWGPHGSGNPFLLIGTWDFDTGTGDDILSEGICYKCHDYDTYRYGGLATGAGVSGFSDGVNTNFHISDDGSTSNRHLGQIDRCRGDGNTYKITCMTCHSGVPHGWKRKGLLVDANNDLEPYKTAANTLVIGTMASSGNWLCDDCHLSVPVPGTKNCPL